VNRPWQRSSPCSGPGQQLLPSRSPLLGCIGTLARTTAAVCRPLASLLSATGLGHFCILLSRVGLFVPLRGLGSRRSAARSSRKNTRWFSGSQSTREGGSSSVCSGFQGRKVLLIPHSPRQIHCGHWLLGRSDGGWDWPGRRSMRDRLLGKLWATRS
jgi:hypothetical protein